MEKKRRSKRSRSWYEICDSFSEVTGHVAVAADVITAELQFGNFYLFLVRHEYSAQADHFISSISDHYFFCDASQFTRNEIDYCMLIT
ncbi:hypothetical protein D4L85_16425 [Chryseolinea soli]|uniref:Uncharacterized protein n=1 Tax=Chryseolinea soli TaxID=2321403 RepID=A0A385SP52_9BACT|nr:hypothetical protein D4L85_16425 [Chryseolinea soli]